MNIAFAAFFGGLFNRIRGGLIPTGSTTIGRFLFAGPIGLFAAYMVDASFGWHGLLLVLLFIGLTFPGLALGHGSYMDLKRMPDTFNELLDKVLPRLGLRQGSYAYEWWGLALKGLCVTAPLGIALGFISSDRALYYAAIGLTMPAWYELAWRVPSHIKGLSRGPELGEVFFGAWLWVALYVSLR